MGGEGGAILHSAKQPSLFPETIREKGTATVHVIQTDKKQIPKALKARF